MKKKETDEKNTRIVTVLCFTPDGRVTSDGGMCSCATPWCIGKVFKGGRWR